MTQTRNGLPIRTGRQIGSAGEADVFEVRGHPDLAFKRYHIPTPERARKLDAMVGTPPDDPMWHLLGHRSIAWPQDVVVDATGATKGFVMPLINGAASLASVAHPRDRRRLGWDWTWRHLLRVALNLSSAVASLHRAGYVIGDVNTQNILVTRDALVTIIDCDSMQVPAATGDRYRCPVATPDFTAPELTNQLGRLSFIDIDRSPESDNFALAILIYMLLFEGTHPYAAEWRDNGDPPNRANRMRDGLFANGGDLRVAPPAGAPPFDICPPELRVLFHAAFVDGAIRPALRPMADAWHLALGALDSALADCKRNPNHVYGTHRGRCPWCERTAVLGVQDPFPPKGAQKATQPRQRGPLRRFGRAYLVHQFFDWLPRLSLRKLAGAAVAVWLVFAMLASSLSGIGATPEVPVEPSVTTTTTVPRRASSPPPTAVRQAPQKVVEPIIDAIVFTRRHGNRSFSIAIGQPDGSSFRTIGMPDPTADVTVSPDGRRLAFTQFGFWGWLLFVSDADGSNVVQVCTKRAGSRCESPAWSPDGERLAFMCGRDICMVDADGDNEERLDLELDEAWDPAFAPDGRSVIFVGRDGIDEDLYLLDLATGVVSRLTHLDGGIGSPEFSPDGRAIAFTWHEEGYGHPRANIYIINADGTGLRAVTNSTDAKNAQPSWSPDGSRIVFVSDRNKLSGDQSFPPYRRYELFVIDVDGSNLTQLSDVDAHAPQWVGAPR